LISSFEPACLAVARDLSPALPRGLLVKRLASDWRDAVAALGCATVNLGRRHASTAAIAAVLAAGLELAVWTVNEADEAAALRAAGASAIITDRPDALVRRI
jgi:glycerophosphoryl diester phosphodiesterase